MFTFTPVAWTFYFCFLLDLKKIYSNTIFQRAFGIQAEFRCKESEAKCKKTSNVCTLSPLRYRMQLGWPFKRDLL